MICVICINTIEFNNKKTLSCEHVFHENCIKDWFKVKRNNCPTCKCKNTNMLNMPIIENNYNEFENLVLNNINKKWDYSKLTLHNKISKRFVKENPFIPWNIENIYVIYKNDHELCEKILYSQIDRISKKRLSKLTKFVRISFISNFPNYNWNWKKLSSDSDIEILSESEDEHQYDTISEDE